MSELAELGWPRARLGEALLSLARESGLEASEEARSIPAPPAIGAPRDQLSTWFETVGSSAGLEVESVKAPFQDVEKMLRRSAPAVLRLPGDGEHERFLLILETTSRHAQVLSRSGCKERVALSTITRTLCEPLERGFEGEVERLLAGAQLSARRQARARAGLIAERASHWEIGGLWQLGLATERSFWADLRQCGLLRVATLLFVAQWLASLVFIVSWAMIGRAALSGELAPAWLAAWCLTLASWVPLRIFAQALQSRLSVDLGARLKRRLFAGSLRMRLEEIRHLGLGQLLGRVLESEAVGPQALNAVVLSVAAGIDLMLAMGVLALGSGGLLSAALLSAWIIVTIACGWRFYRRTQQWTAARLDLTHDLVERMVGHRTRLAQERPEAWHAGEDEVLDRYTRNTRSLDGNSLLLNGWIPGLWLVLGLIGLAPAFLSGATTPAAMAVSLGGVILAWGAFLRLASSCGQLAEFAVTWEQVAPLFHAAGRAPQAGRVLPTREEKDDRLAQAFLRGRSLVLRHPGRQEAVLDGIDFDLREGTHVLLEGASGSGKSSLASLLYGLRAPDSGLLLLDGLDRASWGDQAWRDAVTAAPQFHENHIFTGTLAFNLFFGRADAEALDEQVDAEQLCRELGLGDLIDRMPASLLQGVGETGWQLSHGERSRVFLARALLQRTRLCILDESLAALDSENLWRAVDCLRRRSPTSLVIAHP